MGNIKHWTIKVCPDCDAQVHGGGLCRQHDPPGHPVETAVVRKSEVIVLRERYRGAVEAVCEHRDALDARALGDPAQVARDRDDIDNDLYNVVFRGR